MEIEPPFEWKFTASTLTLFINNLANRKFAIKNIKGSYEIYL